MIECTRCGYPLKATVSSCLRCGATVVPIKESTKPEPKSQSKSDQSPKTKHSSQRAKPRPNPETLSPSQNEQGKKGNEATPEGVPWIILGLLLFVVIGFFAINQDNEEKDLSNNAILLKQIASENVSSPGDISTYTDNGSDKKRGGRTSAKQTQSIGTTQESLEKQKYKLAQKIQQRLTKLLYNPGPADGVVGKKTRAAIADFQRENELVVNGTADIKLFMRLGKRLFELEEQKENSEWSDEDKAKYQNYQNMNRDQLDRASRSGDPIAQYVLGEKLYFNDEYQAAQEWLKLAADSGISEAKNTLGRIHAASLMPSSDPKLGCQLFKEAAGVGNVKAINNVGVCYELGIGVEQDEVRSTRWYRKSANLGYTVAMTNLADNYQLGLGVNTDITHAIKLYETALNLDSTNSLAAHELGQIYLFGWGVPKNAETVSMPV